MAQRRNWIATAPLIGGLVVLATIALLTLGGASNRSGGLRAALFDLYGRLAPIDAPATSQFHIVEIDDESLARVGPWPWPRSELAKVVDGVADAGAKGIVLAVPVDTPDPLTPSTIGAFWLEGARDEGLARELSKLPNTDAVLGDALKRVSSSVVINPGAAADLSRRLEPGSSKIVNTKQFSVLGQTESGRSPLPTSTTISAPLALSRGGGVAPEVTASSAVSVAALPADDDGILRAPPIVWSYDDALVPSAAFAAAAIVAGKGQPVAIADPTATSDAGRIVQSVSLSTDGKGIPVDRTGRAIISWPKKLGVQSTSAARLYDQSTGSNAQLADKVVLIGLGDRLGKIVTTPIGEISALRAHAEVANRLAAGAVLVRPSWSGYLEAGLAMLLGGAAMAWSQTLGGWRSLLLTLFVAAVALAASAFAYTSQALLIDPLPGIVAALLGTFAVTGGRSLAETVGDEKLRGNFRGSLPESTVKALTEEDASSLLKGDYRTITILACEISFMASESEEALGKSPASLTNKISGACQSLRRTIVKLGGAADQSDGGKVFAYFNAPLKTADHEKAACAAALQLVEAMDGINGEFGREIPLQLSIGIATGDCLVGPMGHGRSNRYSAIGDPMEIAQTLRSLAPTYGPAIICDEAIFRSTSHNFAFLELDRCDIGDRQTPTTVFGLVGNPFVKSSKKFRALDGAHRDMLSAYRAGDAHAAKLNLLRIRRSPGADIPLFDIYEERIAELEQKAGPGPALVANKPTASKRTDPDLAEAQTGSPTDGPSGSANDKQGNTAIGSK